MQQKNPSDFFFNDMQKTVKDMMGAFPASNPFDMKAIMEAQRKNMQALAEANGRVFSGWQTIAKRQAEMVSQFVEDNSTLARETMSESTPQDKFSRQAEVFQSCFKRTIENSQELSEMARRNIAEAAELLNSRVLGTFSEIKNAAKTKGE